MRYQKINKNIGRIAIIILSQSSMTGCTAPSYATTDSVAQSKSFPLIYFGTVDSDKEIVKLVTILKEAEDPKIFQLGCDKNKIAQSCYYYASYNDLIADNRKESYPYYKKAFDLGSKQAGYSHLTIKMLYN